MMVRLGAEQTHLDRSRGRCSQCVNVGTEPGSLLWTALARSDGAVSGPAPDDDNES